MRLAALDERFGEQGADRHDAHAAGDPDPGVRPRRPPGGSRCERHQQRLSEQSPRLLVVQFGGAAGTLEKLGDKGPAVRAALAARLGLADAPQWHSQRDTLAEFAGWLSLVTGSLGKFGQDIALMAQDGTRDRAGRRWRLVGHAAQAQSGDGRGAGRAGPLQRHAAFRHASGAGARAGALGRGLDARMAAAAADGGGDARRPCGSPIELTGAASKASVH